MTNDGVNKISPVVLGIWIAGSQLKTLLGVGLSMTLLAEAYYLEKALKFKSLMPFPVHFLCFMLAFPEAILQLLLLPPCLYHVSRPLLFHHGL